MDRAEHQRRYREAIQKGYERRRSDRPAERLKVYLNGAVNPELIPMGEAFFAFCGGAGETEWETTTRAKLQSYGISSRSAKEIVRTTGSAMAKKEKIAQELGEPLKRFYELLYQLAEREGNSAYARRYRESDAEEIAQLLGRDSQEVARLIAAYNRSPIIESTAEALANLKSSLSPNDWDVLRSYLSLEIAPKRRIVEFEAGN